MKDKSSVFRLFAFIFRHYKGQIALVAVCILVSSLTSLASSLFTRTLIDDYITPMLNRPSSLFGGVGIGPDYHPLAIALVKLAAVLLAGIVAGFLYNLLMIKVGQGTMKLLRQELFAHMETLPIGYFDSHSHGGIMSVYTNDIDTLKGVVGDTVPRLAQSVVTIVATLVSMLVMNLPLTLVSVLIAFVMYKITTGLGKLSKKYFKQRQENLGIVNGFIEEMVSGQRVVKVFCRERQSLEHFAKINEDLRSSVFNANKISNIIMPLNGNLSNMGYVLMAIIGSVIAIGGNGSWYMCGLNGSTLTLGTLVAFLTLHKQLTRPVSHISNEINSIVKASAGTDRFYALMDELSEVDEGKVELVKDGESSWSWQSPDGQKRKLEGLVSLKDVDFGYVPEKQVLHDITLTAYPGQKIAFVGGTGAGKTTITNLVNRFYEIQDGTITYDGFDVRDISKQSLRRSLGMVLQETHLFTGTVLDNIRYGRIDATDEECIAAACLVQADGFIRNLPDGYGTMLTGDGGNLSQGERQLLAIARAAVANPPVLILDEATSSIDTRTEQMIQRGMDSLMKGRTTFVIAHRLSTVMDADYIMVLDHGRIIERGKHQELLDIKGKYFDLFTGNQI
ncbi:MAG: ABC transporter ATP-binding protein/permease [Bacteroidales bacterium]|nr:ABC transporter ATP-binding protein/permease [Bacteroidales bacterium]